MFKSKFRWSGSRNSQRGPFKEVSSLREVLMTVEYSDTNMEHQNGQKLLPTLRASPKQLVMVTNYTSPKLQDHVSIFMNSEEAQSPPITWS